MRDDPHDTEWHDPANWHGGLLGIYVAPRDPRTWVPKRRPGFGWTLNFARPASWAWLAAILALPLATLVATTLLGR